MPHDRLSPVTLEGRTVRLEPLARHHAAGLYEAASEDSSSYAYARVPESPEDAAAIIEALLAAQAAGHELPFAVRHLASGRLVGATRFLDMATLHPGREALDAGRTVSPPTDASPPSVVEIGGTWYAASAQRTAVNTETKLLMLRHAFESWRVLRVTFKTNARNQRSRDAVLRIGAIFEGVRRRHMIGADGTLRDTAYYSVVAEEWPAVREALLARLER